MGSPVKLYRSPSLAAVLSPSRSSNLGSPQQLTPRSKIKAMLAAVDDESDSEARVEASTIHGNDSSTDHVNRHPASPRPSTHESGEDSAEESDDAPVVPRGRLAARLQNKTSFNDIKISSEEDGPEGNAYERIKKQLLPNHMSREASTEGFNQAILGDGDGTTAPSGRRQRLQSRKEPRASLSPIGTPAGRSNRPPGLSPTPEAASPSINHQDLGNEEDSDRDSPDPHANQRFLALVARKRAEREAKQAVEAEKKAAREARLRENSAKALGVSEDESDDNAGAKKLTQQARPTRKASKKALEEMNRETQRMNRNMQLAHQARTKKKITKESLFARFNFRTSDPSNAEIQQALSSSTAASSVPASDAENGQAHATPPTSPLRPSDLACKLAVAEDADGSIQTSAVAEEHLDSDSELPTIQNIIDNPQPAASKGKEKAAAPDPITSGDSADEFNTEFKRLPIKIRLQKSASRSKLQGQDSDSDLEILPRQVSKSRLDAFNRLPTTKAGEGRSLLKLRALAHLQSPEKQCGRTRASMTLSDMQTSLRQRARQQAAAERAEKIQDLKARGVIFQTAEERQKDQVEVEDLVEKARKEAEEIKRKEKDAVRNEKRANGELVSLDNTSDEDEDYEENGDNASGAELSGSDEEGGSSDEDVSGSENSEGGGEDDEAIGGVGVDGNTRNRNGLIEDEASEDSQNEGSAKEIELAADETTGDEEIDVPLPQRKARATRVIDDDDDEEPLQEPLVNPSPPTEDTPGKPIIPDLGFSRGPNMPMMGMTQAFAATMADTQDQIPGHMIVDQNQDSLQVLGFVPEPDFPVFDPNDTESMVMDSQNGKDSMVQGSTANEDISLHFSQSQIEYDNAQESQRLLSATQDDEIPDPTQDVGFGLSSPAANRFVNPPPSTVDTVVLPGPESPVKKKKGRLQRRNNDATDQANDDDSHKAREPADFEISANAFDVMKRKRAAAVTTKAYDKKKSEAKEMVEEQALESEDEYAGLGGVSDDESGGSEDEEARQMIDHGDVEVDERKLAAFHA
ncbi:MAG: hypothetical protein Q9191_006146 [Dirinaria sp. TL-2023a]